MNNRAKQFMPFSALKGYYEIIRERQNVYEEKKELSEDEAAVLSEKLSCVKKGDMVKVTYYKEMNADGKTPGFAKGGKYTTVEGLVWEIDTTFRVLTIVKTKIPFDDILDISGSTIPE